MEGENTQAVEEQEQGQEPTSTGEAEAPEAEAAQGTETTQAAGSVDELPEWARNMVSELRSENAKHRKAKKAAEREAQAAEEARLEKEKEWQKLAEKRAQERDEALGKLAAMELRLLRQGVAQAAGLPAELAARLQGETREELEADAKKLKALIPEEPEETPSGPGATGGPRRRARKAPQVEAPKIRL